ncbi:MAG: hypothetical protein C4B57_01065 [Deltaproteobacteria bacterium]|nr:MAG: hypothetical protein C4B57_01065 [Deltaproteobacteria bacterium]RKX59496.1 MAG: hypothetical protein DRP28_03045 [Thermodesulfobacteriota bacterium]
MIPLKNPICGVASIFHSLRRTISTPRFRKILRLASACRQAGPGPELLNPEPVNAFIFKWALEIDRTH